AHELAGGEPHGGQDHGVTHRFVLSIAPGNAWRLRGNGFESPYRRWLRQRLLSQGGNSLLTPSAVSSPPETPLARRRRCATPPRSAVRRSSRPRRTPSFLARG